MVLLVTHEAMLVHNEEMGVCHHERVFAMCEGMMDVKSCPHSISQRDRPFKQQNESQ